jgi:two-component system, NtrC family, sensor kinase
VPIPAGEEPSFPRDGKLGPGSYPADALPLSEEICPSTARSMLWCKIRWIWRTWREVTVQENRRILLVDDLASIHEDFRKTLVSGKEYPDVGEEEAILFGREARTPQISFEVDSAYQGVEALEKIRAAQGIGRPYAMAFLDMRMPPGWDGVETAERLWAADPRLQIVFCTAYSDTSWQEVLGRLDVRDRLLILKKPFDTIEAYQLASALTSKWGASEAAANRASELEATVDERTREIEQSREMYRLMAESTNAIPFILDLTRGRFTYVGTRALAEFSLDEARWKEPGALELVMPRATHAEVRQRFDECEIGAFEFVAALAQGEQEWREVRWTGTCEEVAEAKILRGLMLDITEVRRLGRELAAAQKLESVGRLAAGVAHEINTPVQFVSDNVNFLRSAASDIASVVEAYRELRQSVESQGDVAGASCRAAEAEKRSDLDYVLENMPLAIDSSLEGLERIAKIVRSMKEFAHPDQSERTSADLNHAIQSTLTIAHNEYKYVAELATDFGELPPVMCFLGELNQVVLNLLVNAAHAIGDAVKDTGEKGKLTVTTRLDGDAVEIAISDTGTGIPEAIRPKIFDPFFTTKEVGKGTGQGLAISHSVIVKKHGGSLRFESECGKGTTFFIRLPLDAPGERPADKAVAS